MDRSLHKPFFTIVIPTIGRVEDLSRALTSTLKQKFTDFEVIVVDNSHETTLHEKIKSSIETYGDRRFKYLCTDLIERSNARNWGIEHSNSQYICFLDEDDEINEDHLQVIYQSIKENQFPVAIFRSGMYHVNEKGDILHRSIHCPSKEDPIVFFLDHMVGIHTLCFHRDILKKVRFHPSYYYFEDTHLLIRTLFKFPFFQIKEHTCIYNKKIQESSVKQLKSQLNNNIGCIEDLFTTYYAQMAKHLDVEKWRKYMLQKKYLDYAFVNLNKNKSLSFELFIKSLKTGVDLKLLKRYMKYVINYLNVFKYGNRLL